MRVWTVDSQRHTLHDRIAGYYVSEREVTPAGVTLVTDVFATLKGRGVDVRVLRSLRPLRDAVAASTLGFSIIRMRNAAPPLTSTAKIALPFAS